LQSQDYLARCDMQPLGPSHPLYLDMSANSGRELESW
jgi:hypothetical protein